MALVTNKVKLAVEPDENPGLPTGSLPFSNEIAFQAHKDRKTKSLSGSLFPICTVGSITTTTFAQSGLWGHRLRQAQRRELLLEKRYLAVTVS